MSERNDPQRNGSSRTSWLDLGPKWLTAIAAVATVVVTATLGVLEYVSRDGDPSATSPSPSVAASVQPQLPSSAAPTEGPDEVPNFARPDQEIPALEYAENFYSVDGSVPDLFPDCLGLLSFCQGNHINDVYRAFGESDQEFAGAESGTTFYQWYLEDGLLFLTVETNDRERITEMTATITVGTLVRVAIPPISDSRSSNLVLGDLEMGEVVEAFGYEAVIETIPAEGDTIVTQEWDFGPEGTFDYAFSCLFSWSDDPDVLNASDDEVQRVSNNRQVSSVSIGLSS